MKKHHYIIITLSLALLISLSFLYLKQDGLPMLDPIQINSFSDCVAAGNLVMETYPEQCRTIDGRLFVRNINDDELPAGLDNSIGFDSLEFTSFTASNWPYTTFQDWGVELKKVNSTYIFTCQESDNYQDPAHTRRSLTLNDRLYCVESSSEGAAGSIYTAYNYTSLINEFLITVKVTVREINCDNYDKPQQTDCKAERKIFNIDKLIDDSINLKLINY